MNRVVNRIMRNDLNAIDSHGARGTSCNFAQMVLKAKSQQTFGFAHIYVDYTIIIIVKAACHFPRFLSTPFDKSTKMPPLNIF